MIVLILLDSGSDPSCQKIVRTIRLIREGVIAQQQLCVRARKRSEKNVAEQRCGHRRWWGQRDGSALPIAFICGKEEQLVLLDWTAQRTTKLVPYGIGFVLEKWLSG